MAQTITQLVGEMQTLRDRLASGSAENASGDVDAAVDALDGALAVLTGAAAPENDTPDVPPYAIVAAEPGPPDNLTLIRGISSATAYALTNLGITRFAHVSGLTARDVGQLGQDLGYRCTIHRDNWIEQAAVLAAGGSTRFSRRGGPMTAAVTAGDDAPDVVPAADTPVPVALGGLSAVLAGGVLAANTGGKPGDPATSEVTPVQIEPLAPAVLKAAGPFEELILASVPANVETVPAPEIIAVDPEPIVDGSREEISSPFVAVAEEVSASEDVVAVQAVEPIVQSATGTSDLSGADEDGGGIETTREEAAEPAFEPEPLIAAPDLDDEDAPVGQDDVFATLPEPIAIVPRAIATSDPLADDPAVSGILVTEPAVPEPKAIPILEGLDANTSLPPQSINISDDEAQSKTPQAIESTDSRDNAPASLTGIIATVTPDADSHATAESEAAIDIRVPLDFAPAEPTFATIIQSEKTPAAGVDDADISITRHPDEPEASGPVAANTATIDPLPEPFSPHRTAVSEAEIVIVRDGEPETPAPDVPELEDRGRSIVGRLTRVFRRKS